jgi:hypothetical protein
MPSHQITLTVQAPGQTLQSIPATVTADTNLAISETLAPSTTNQGVVASITNANIYSLVLQSVGGDCTIKTNSTSSPGNTVAMTAGQVIVYSPSTQANIGTNPFAAANVTELYLSSTAGTTFILNAILNN